MQDGINRMYGEKQEDVFYYMTTLNEVMDQPAMPAGAEEGIRKGLYKFETVEGKKRQRSRSVIRFWCDYASRS